jgi:hypothetical protein
MYKNLQPCGGEEEFTRGRLRLSKSLFGSGFVLLGTHPAISADENHAIMNRAQQMASMVLPTLTCNRSVVSLQAPELLEPDLQGEGRYRYNSPGEITSSEETKVGMVEDTHNHAPRAET